MALALTTFLGLSGMLSGGAGTAKSAPFRPIRCPEAGLLFYEGYSNRDNTEAVGNPYVVGPLFQLYWSEIEKENGVCDWSDWDRRIKPWLAAGKKIALRLMWCSSGNWPLSAARTPTPQWVWREGARFAFYEPAQTEIPLFWDPIFEKCAWRFMEEVARKFDNDPNVLFIDVTPGAETNPYRFRVFNTWKPEFRDQYASTPASDGRPYSNELWLETVKQYIDASRRTFKNTPLLVTLNNGGMGASRFEDIGAYCVDRGFYVGQNGLSPDSYLEDSGRRRAFAEWGQRIPLFFEMVDPTGETLNSLLKKWGRPPVPESGPAIDTSTLMDYMKVAERIHASYLNVYGEDVLKGTKGSATYDPAYEEALKYGASVLARRSFAEARMDANGQ